MNQTRSDNLPTEGNKVCHATATVRVFLQPFEWKIFENSRILQTKIDVSLWCPTHNFWLWEMERAVESTAPKASSRSRTGEVIDYSPALFPRVSGKPPMSASSSSSSSSVSAITALDIGIPGCNSTFASTVASLLESSKQKIR